MNPLKGVPRTLIYLITALVIIIILSLSVILSLGRIRSSVEASGVIAMIREHRSAQSREGESLYTLYYPLMSATEDTYRYTSTRVSVTVQESSYHSLLEALLAPLPQGPLLEGAVSFIPEGTRLIGFTVRGSIGYVSLSPEFLEDTPFEQCSYERRTDQIRKTLLENFSLEEVVFIVSDVILDIEG